MNEENFEVWFHEMRQFDHFYRLSFIFTASPRLKKNSKRSILSIYVTFPSYARHSYFYGARQIKTSTARRMQMKVSCTPVTPTVTVVQAVYFPRFYCPFQTSAKLTTELYKMAQRQPKNRPNNTDKSTSTINPKRKCFKGR